MEILDSKQIKQKIRRLAFEIAENNFAEDEIILAGINNNGVHFAKLLIKELKKIKPILYTLTHIKLNPAFPLDYDIQIGLSSKELKDKVVLIVDDVANTGRTIFYAAKPLLESLPKKVQVVVLVDRKHKSFPMQSDYVGLSLATTLRENIEVSLKPLKTMHVALH